MKRNLLVSVIFLLVSGKIHALPFLSPQINLNPVIGDNRSLPDHYQRLNFFSAIAVFPLPHDLLLKAELQGGSTENHNQNPGYLASLVEVKFSFLKSDNLNLSLVSRMFSPGSYRELSVREVRESFLLPVEFRYNKKFSTGLTYILEEDSEVEDVFNKTLLSWFSSFKISPEISTEVSVFAVKPQEENKLMCTDVNVSLNVQLNRRTKVNLAALASLLEPVQSLSYLATLSFAF